MLVSAAPYKSMGKSVAWFFTIGVNPGLRITIARDKNHSLGFESGNRVIKHSLKAKPMYSRTQNENGSFNTRCLYCFLTIASAVESEQELDRIEAQHFCPEKVLAQMHAQQNAQPVHPMRS
jgi:hypothetical protein